MKSLNNPEKNLIARRIEKLKNQKYNALKLKKANRPCLKSINNKINNLKTWLHA